ncbi:MAG: HI0074 family nucleotidyltransferase substrate-binding subunit [Cellulosilyticaceae bacterium]
MKEIDTLGELEFVHYQLDKACIKLQEVCVLYDGQDDIIRDSMIRRFNIAYELTHKTLQEFMKFEGVTLENSFPRTIYKKAYANGMIQDEKLWLSLLEDRNKTSHMYSESLADEIAGRIKGSYVGAIGSLVGTIGKYISE